MQQTIPRPALLDAVLTGLCEAPVVALLGARQVGKTTLAERVAEKWPGGATVFDLEVAPVREALSATPLDLLLLRRGRRWGFEFKRTDAPRAAIASGRPL